MGSTWSYLDITALGRQEDWEDSPEGPADAPYKWWNWHDEYGKGSSSQWSSVIDRSLEILRTDSNDGGAAAASTRES